MSQSFILNDERLMGQSNHRMPVAAEKGVEGGTACPLIFLSLGDEAKDEGSDLTRREPLPTKQGFQFQQQRGGRISLLSPRGRRHVPFKVSKKENFVKEKQTKQLVTSHPRKELHWPKPLPKSTFFLHLNPSTCAQQETILP